MKTYAILFPGQGSQFVGMGADVFDARPDLLGDAANEILGWSLSTVVSQGPDEELTRTDRAQAALYELDPEAKIAPMPQQLSGDSNGDPCCCGAPNRPPWCPPICVPC